MYYNEGIWQVRQGKKNRKKMFAPPSERTVDNQVRGVTCGTSFVRRRAAIDARVSRGHVFDTQNTVLFRRRENVDVPVLFSYRHTVDRPRYLHRQVTLDDGTNHGYGVPGIGRLLRYLEWRDLRSDCNVFFFFKILCVKIEDACFGWIVYILMARLIFKTSRLTLSITVGTELPRHSIFIYIYTDRYILAFGSQVDTLQ